jgi:hypothetical protein
MTDNSVIMLHDVRLSFPHLETPHAPPGTQTTRYSADFILDPTNPTNAADWKAVNDLILAAATEKWGENTGYILEMLKPLDKQRDLGDGNNRRKKDMSVMDGYANMFYVKSRSQNRPNIIGASGKTLEPLQANQSGEKKPYGGCYCNGLVRLWLQDNQYGQGIRFELLGVQFLRDGTSFGPAEVNAEGYFKPVEGAPPPVTGGGGTSFL